MGVSCINVIKWGHNIKWGIMGDDEAMISVWRSVRVHGNAGIE